jgi:DNA-binding MarR family transcriptional regulator
MHRRCVSLQSVDNGGIEPLWLDDDEQRAWRAFLQASTRLLERLDAELEAEAGLSLADYEILVHLADAPDGLRMTDLAGRALVSRSGLTRRVDRLTCEGLVDRLPCPTDRRGVVAVLTEPGRARLVAAAPSHVAGVRRHFVDALGSQDLRALAAALDAVRASAEAPTPG